MSPSQAGGPREGPTRVTLEARVCVSGEEVGRVADVVLDPRERRLTHIVVATRDGDVRLVPFDVVAGTADDGRTLELRCKPGEIEKFASIRHATVVGDESFVTEAGTEVGVEEAYIAPAPYIGGPDVGGGFAGTIEAPVTLSYDLIPEGEAEIRGRSEILSSSGESLGPVVALELRDAAITHLVLRRGHFWRRRESLVPIDLVDSIRNDRITLSVEKAAVV